MVVNKQKLIELGLQYNFLNYIDHETPRNYFPYPVDVYTDTDDMADLRLSIHELHVLLRAIYEQVDIV